ncbi:Pyoverdine/dityrosine biosynthesis protein-domain-containing protein [Xylaria sp. FL0043]|nr:Pyoverdine/dityrosine biosynthesis protein-domain-containing protein [Xylaria sp. FL0043]
MPSAYVQDLTPTILLADKSSKEATQSSVDSGEYRSDREASIHAEGRNEDVGSHSTTRSPQTIATEVLNIICSYGVHSERNSGKWDAFDEFLPIVTKKIMTNAPITMLLPGFPFKEESEALVLGQMPDFGEELALAHLQGLCDNISAIYENGANIIVCSDGLVYNDLLGVSEEIVWEYGEALRATAARKELHNIKFIRLWDVLDYTSKAQINQEHLIKDRVHYLEQAASIRQELLRSYSDEQFNASATVKVDEDYAATRAAYIGILSKKATIRSPESTSEQMITRGKAYGTALRLKFPDYVRLSIHDSNGKGKLSLTLIPSPGEKGVIGLMPWRSAVAVDADGSYRAVYPEQVRDTHELVYNNGRPYFYRVKSALFEWTDSGLRVDFEHLYPCGLIIRPVDCSPSMRLIPMQKVRHLSNHFSPIVLRGFSETTNEDVWVEKGHELGDILSWALTGTIFKVVNARDDSKMANNVTSNEPLPMHFDGVFKFAEQEDPVTGEIKKVLNPPGYQYFTCLSTAPKGDGYTLFCTSRLVFRYLPLSWPLHRLQPVTWEMSNDGFWSNVHKGLPLVVRHPTTGAPCLRWHSPWDSDKTKYSSYKIMIENEEQSLVQLIEKMTYDYRTCLRFSWEKGDLLVSDNVAMLHTRTSYASNCDREMWRIHLD